MINVISFIILLMGIRGKISALYNTKQYWIKLKEFNKKNNYIEYVIYLFYLIGFLSINGILFLFVFLQSLFFRQYISNYVLKQVSFFNKSLKMTTIIHNFIVLSTFTMGVLNFIFLGEDLSIFTNIKHIVDYVM